MKVRHSLLIAALLAGASPVRLLRAQEPAPVRSSDRGILVDFQDADLRVVITALAEAGAINVTYGELPARRLTLRMQQPVQRAAVPALLRSLAKANGLQIDEEGDLWRISGGSEPPVSVSRDSTAQNDPRLFVHQLRHARAARIASTLQSIFGGGGRSAGESQSLPPRRSLSDQLRDQRLPAAGADSVPARADDQRPPGLPGQLSGEVQIVPDEATNSLLVRAEPADWEIVQQAIQAMDLRPLQVLIEVAIVELRHSRGLDVGISARGAKTLSGTTIGGELKSNSATDFIVKLQRAGSLNLDVAIAALTTRGEVRILSRPILFAQNNQEAKILVGSQRPFVQVFRSLPTDAGVRDQVVQYRDVGTSLSIVPTINPDDYVNLQVNQEVSTATDELQFGAPVISTREAATHLFVRNGQTAVIGGLVDRQEDRSRSGIPLLSAIPFIGGVFGSTRITSTTSELFLFLTPYLVRTDEEMEEVRLRIERGSSMPRSPSVLEKKP